MIDLNKTQGIILQKFVENFTDKLGKYPSGLSSLDLEHLGIERKTFRKHKEFLQDNYLIRINKIGYHGHQHWFNYQITKLGVIAYLKWVLTKKAIKKATITKLSFPFIIRYWDNLYEKYGKLLKTILIHSMHQIEVEPSMTVEHEKDKQHSRMLNEVITLSMDDIQFRIFRQYEPPQPIPTKNLKGDVMRIDDFSDRANSEIDSSITNRFTFLFFFNLINFGLESWQKLVIFSAYKNAVKDGLQFQKDFLRVGNLLSKNSNYVIELIKKDKVLRGLFCSMLNEISSKLQDVKAINLLKKELS